MSDIFRLRNGRSRAINAENPTGEKGKGGIARKAPLAAIKGGQIGRAHV